MGQEDRIEGQALALHVADFGLIQGTTYSVLLVLTVPRISVSYDSRGLGNSRDLQNITLVDKISNIMLINWIGMEWKVLLKV